VSLHELEQSVLPDVRVLIAGEHALPPQINELVTELVAGFRDAGVVRFFVFAGQFGDLDSDLFTSPELTLGYKDFDVFALVINV
jgi:hypothetical protein